MTPERHKQIGELYHAALRVGREQRAAFLDRACANDAALRHEVESLIRSHEEATRFIEKPAMAVAAELLAGDEPEGLVGLRIGRYTIISFLGAGGMGRVFLAEDVALDRRVALKFLPELFTHDKSQVRRFRQEARAASALNHPNILTVYEVGQVDDTEFIAAEYVEGETLRSRLANGALEISEALDVAAQVADALGVAHQAGIIHRDIKPDNIMIRRDGYVKVLDFGLAKLTEIASDSASAGSRAQQSAISTSPGLVMGTAEYMSPEQARGLPIDERTDVWSLSVVLYEMLAGKRPFAAATHADAIVSILERKPLPLSRHVHAPMELERIVAKALTKNRQQRYQQISEMAEDLRRLRRRLDAGIEVTRSPSRRSHPAHQEPLASCGLDHRISETHTGGRQSVKTRATSSIEFVISQIKKHKRGAAFFTAVFAILVSGAAYGSYRLWKLLSPARAGFRETRMTRITSTGRTALAAISPDGRYVAYVEFDDKQQSLWIKQLATGGRVQIVPAANVSYWGLTFSNDSNYVFYIRNEDGQGAFNKLYEVPARGGVSRSVLDHIDSAVTFSPDGQRFAFLRDNLKAEETILMLTSADGKPEQALAISKPPHRFGSDTATRIAWSPDGRIIACATNNTDADGQSGSLVGVSIDDGTQKLLTNKRWGFVTQVTWLADGNGLAVIGSEVGSAYAQVWHLSYPSGEARRITNDLNHYVDATLTRDSGMLATVQAILFSNVWVGPSEDANRARQVTNGTLDGYGGLAWTRGGQIVYKSTASGQPNIWIMNADGSDQRQLTHEGVNVQPSVSRDGKIIFFTSARAGAVNVWRMDLDGSDLKQLTQGKANYNAHPSPDGEWVVYVSADRGNGSLWKIPADGGQPVQLAGPTVNLPIVSPDGQHIAVQYWDEHANPPRGVMILPFAGGAPLKRLNIQLGADGFALQWAANARALLYLDGQLANIWSQPADGGQPVARTNFAGDQIFNFSYSPDGKRLAIARGRKADDVVLITDLK